MTTASTALICGSLKWDEGRGWLWQEGIWGSANGCSVLGEHWSAVVSVETHSVLGFIKWLL